MHKTYRKVNAGRIVNFVFQYLKAPQQCYDIRAHNWNQSVQSFIFQSMAAWSRDRN